MRKQSYDLQRFSSGCLCFMWDLAFCYFFFHSCSKPSISLLISYASLPIIIFCLFRPFAALAALKTQRQARGWTPGDRPRSGTLSRITRHPGMSNWHSLWSALHPLCIAVCAFRKGTFSKFCHSSHGEAIFWASLILFICSFHLLSLLVIYLPHCRTKDGLCSVVSVSHCVNFSMCL